MAGIYTASSRPDTNTVGKVNNAGIWDIEQIKAQNIDPRSIPGLDVRKAGYDPNTLIYTKGGPAGRYCGLKSDMKKTLRIQDMQDAMNTFTWENLPNGLDSKLIEWILYYRGQGVFFYLEATDKFYFLPYALGNKGIDCYGRYKSIKPIPMTGAADEGEEKKEFIPGLDLDVYYDIVLQQLSIEEIMNSAVIIRDYGRQMSQNIIPRQQLNDPIVDLESDMLPFARTALLNSTGVMGMRVQSEDEQSNVTAASASINRAALTGEKYVAIVGNIDFQELTGDKIGTADQFLMTMQAIDNFRLATHGLDSGGIFQKQAHMLESENQMNAGKSSYTLQDRLWERAHACDIINSIFGLDIQVRVSDMALGVDQDNNGMMVHGDPDTVSYASSEYDNPEEGGE